jgi:hypothetical protein
VLGLAALTLALVASNSRADDQSAGVPMPAWRTTPAGGVRPRSATVHLSSDVVNLEWKLDAVGPATPALSWAGPMFGWMGEGEAFPNRQFPELLLFIDGRSTRPAESFEVRVKGRDISELVRRAGLDPFAIAETPPFLDAQKASAADLSALEALGAIRREGDQWITLWESRRLIDLPLSNARSQSVRMQWSDRAAFEMLTAAQIMSKTRVSLYCLTRSDMASRLKRIAGTGNTARPVKGRPGAVLFNVVEYSIPITIDGRAPASTQLRVKGPASRIAPFANALFVCGPGGSGAVMDVRTDKTAPSVTAQRPVRPDTSGRLRLMLIGAPSPGPSGLG